MKYQVFAAMAAVAFSATASAQGYGVISAGTSKLDLDCTGATTCDKSGAAFKLLGGYRFAPAMAAEAGYFSFGKAKAADATSSTEVSNTAFGGGLAFHGDLSPTWNAVARIGLAQVKTKITASIVGLGSASDSDSNIALYGGLGVGYKLSKTMSVDGAWDFSKSKYNKNGANESGDINAFSIGLTFGF